MRRRSFVICRCCVCCICPVRSPCRVVRLRFVHVFFDVVFLRVYTNKPSGLCVPFIFEANSSALAKELAIVSLQKFTVRQFMNETRVAIIGFFKEKFISLPSGCELDSTDIADRRRNVVETLLYVSARAEKIR